MAFDFELVVDSIVKLSETAKAIRFRSSKKVDFLPGQFFMLQFNLKEKNGFTIPEKKESIQKRAFSISSSPSSSYIEITAKKTENPFVSAYLAEHMEIGEKVLATGPYGRFFFNENEARNNILLLGAGSGIAPLICIVRHILEKKFPLNIRLVYSNKSENEILWKDEIEKLAKENDDFNYIFTITQDAHNTAWKGERGRINSNMVKKMLKDERNTDCYLCGPLEFVKEMEKILSSLNIENNRIKKEIYE